MSPKRTSNQKKRDKISLLIQKNIRLLECYRRNNHMFCHGTLQIKFFSRMVKLHKLKLFYSTHLNDSFLFHIIFSGTYVIYNFINDIS